ncbi:uncharacterized protein LOC116779282 [Danaus plexippus]|uniref:C3 and PZP alpha-2-macroglobulin domain-containing protein 8 n=1 Tax=Danaus plexippus plexippus TaxID=278856 RepID=A0A212EGS2_DANPL|nr:uncharacterized protein LOC116779282 [Danaus plexippus]OWR40674.1 C3 and PZP alpha-2-macroglobulin domain-containing protein 8 [Danaus plexippus plexippus]
MGDFVEFVLGPANKKQFDEINTQTLVFYVKGEQIASIALSEEPGDQRQYNVVLGDDQCSINEYDECVSTAVIPNILSKNKYQRYWISWYGHVIKFGQNKDGKPILAKEIDKECHLNCITFFHWEGLNEKDQLHWKCLLPQDIPSIQLKQFEEGNAEWVKAEEQLPDNAVIGGFENEVLYIVRSKHRGSLTPGKFVPSEGIGYISWGGEAHPKAGENLEILCGYNFVWSKTYGNRIPSGAIEGGHSEVNHESLYVGRVEHEGCLIPGKVQPSHKVCYFSFDGREVPSREYEILLRP